VEPYVTDTGQGKASRSELPYGSRPPHTTSFFSQTTSINQHSTKPTSHSSNHQNDSGDPDTREEPADMGVASAIILVLITIICEHATS
jgi:hypothetical protein